jgi:hypothetical protein
MGVFGGGILRNATGATWANALKMAALKLDGATTGTSYASGTFTDGRSLTSANLDTYNGLQDPRSGARFATN